MSLQVDKLSKRYDDKWILRDVSFSADRGKVTGIFGTSGAGKSLLLRAIAGFEKATGSVTFDSNAVSRLNPQARKFYLPGRPSSSFLERLTRSDTSARLSSGERAAGLLAAALESPNNVLLLDDPFCSMDDSLKHGFIHKLRQAVSERNLAVVLATSDYQQVFAVCDSVAVLIGGAIEQTGTPQSVYSNPSSFESARMTGPNNLFEARRLTSSKSDNPQFQTMIGEHRLTVNKIERSGLGAINQNIWLGIRPEHISIAFGASFPEDNLLKAVITKVRLLGSTTLVELDANGLPMMALVLRLVGLNVGDDCMLGLPPDRIQVFKR